MALGADLETTDIRILDLAADHIRRYGLERTTVVSIAREAGMSHANIYRYYPSKGALIDAVTAHWLKPLETGLREIADAPDPARDKLERMLAAVFRAYREKLERDPAVFALFSEAVTEARGIARKHRARLRATLFQVVEAGIAEAAFEASDPQRAVLLVFDLMHRFIHPVCIAMDAEAQRVQLEGRFERVLSIVLRGLAQGVS